MIAVLLLCLGQFPEPPAPSLPTVAFGEPGAAIPVASWLSMPDDTQEERKAKEKARVAWAKIVKQCRGIQMAEIRKQRVAYKNATGRHFQQQNQNNANIGAALYWNQQRQIYYGYYW
jgi:hypothetical protein